MRLRALEGATIIAWTILAALAPVCMAFRVGYPYALEWMEGNQWYSSYRMANGLQVYGDPDITGFLPHPYPPLHTWMAAVALRVFGEELWPPRLVSILFTVACVALIARAVWSRTRTPAAAWLGACMFLGYYGVLDTWYDLIRVDMSYVALLLAAFTLWDARVLSPWRASGALLLAGLALLAKQPALITFSLAVAYCIWRRVPRWRVLVPVALAVHASIHLLLHHMTDGWYTFWVWELPSGHDVQWQRFFPGGLARAVWIAGLPLGVAALQWGTSDNPLRSRGEAAGFRTRLLCLLRAAAGSLRGSIWGLALLASFIASATTYSKVGAGINNWTFFAAVTSVVAASALGRRATRRLRATCHALLLLQAVLCLYDPRSKIPSSADRAAGDDLVATVRSIPGGVLVLDDAYIALRAGQEPYIGGMTLGDLNYAGHPPPESLMRRLRRRDFAAILLRFDFTDPRHVHPVPTLIRHVYTGRKVPIEYASEEVFLPVAGGSYKPRWLLFRPESR